MCYCIFVYNSGVHVRIARLWDKWRHAFAVKKLRQSKIKISRQSQVANAKRSPNA